MADMEQREQIPLVLCEGLVKIYQVDELEVVALQGLDLQIQQGEFMAIVGTSGSGKSTLLNILGGLDLPSAGRISVGGRNLLKLSDQELERYRLHDVGFVWQQASRNLLPYLTAQENVELPLLAAGAGGAEATAQALALLDSVKLSDRRHHRLRQLSGGQQQRVAIAVALANRPRLLLADEPTGEVDSTTAQEIWRLLRQLNQHYGLTTIIVSHDRDIARIVDRVIGIGDGRISTEIVRQGPGAAVMAGSPTVPSHRDSSGGPAKPPEIEHLEERVVLDMAGRLQMPQDYLEQRGIRRRAIVQLVEEGILVRPIQEEVAQPAQTAAGIPGVGEEPVPAQRPGWWQRLWRRSPHPQSHTTAFVEAAPVVASWRQRPQPSGAQSIAQDQPLVRVVDLSRHYQVGGQIVHALQGIHLQIQPHTFAVFRGRSGSGKTTLLNLIGGLDQPTSGHVSLLGQDLGAMSEDQRAELRQQHVGFVFQAFSLLPTLSAQENVEMVLRMLPLTDKERRQRALYCLHLVGLSQWADHRPFEMSGGQQQRISIARALARHPDVIIADEPTSDLDSDTGRQILELFQRLVAEEQMTVLMASHDITSDEYATEVYYLQDGRLVDHTVQVR
jgi:peptide/nickel transport system ATP-binding protein